MQIANLCSGERDILITVSSLRIASDKRAEKFFQIELWSFRK